MNDDLPASGLFADQQQEATARGRVLDGDDLPFTRTGHFPPLSQPQEYLSLVHEPADSEGDGHLGQRDSQITLATQAKLVQVTANEPLRNLPDIHLVVNHIDCDRVHPDPDEGLGPAAPAPASGVSGPRNGTRPNWHAPTARPSLEPHDRRSTCATPRRARRPQQSRTCRNRARRRVTSAGRALRRPWQRWPPEKPMHLFWVMVGSFG